MKYLYLIVLVIILGFNTQLTFAKSQIFILHINGVNTTDQEALINSLSLRDSVPVTSNIITWNYIFNPTSGLLISDLWDVMNQKRQEKKDLSIDDYVMAYMKNYALTYKPGSKEYNELKDKIKQSYLDDKSFVGRNLSYLVGEFHKKVPREFSAIKIFLSPHTTNKSTYVLLVPHSQGNLYANQLWDFLVHTDGFPENNISIFGIGTPADQMAGHRFPPASDEDIHVTAENDFVIGSLRAFSKVIPITNPLTPNIHLYSCGDLMCHNLVDSYLKDTSSRERITKSIALHIAAFKHKIILEGVFEKRIKLAVYTGGITNTADLMHNGEILCKYNEMGCSDKLGYVNFKEDFTNMYDPLQGVYFDANDTLSGELTIITHDDFIYPNIHFKGSLKSANEIQVDLASCKTWTTKDTISVDNYGIKSAAFRCAGGFDCKAQFPELFYNENFVCGKISI